MPRERVNVVVDLVELDLRLSEAEDETIKDPIFQIRSSLRASYADMYCANNQIAFRATICRLNIRLVLSGFEQSPGRRSHDDLRLSGSTIKLSDRTESKTERSVSGSIGGKIGSTIPVEGSADASAQAKKSWSDSTTRESTLETTVKYVTARPGDRWEVHDTDKPFLNGTYLIENDPLCTVDRIKGANRGSATAYVEVFQKDLKIDISSDSKIRRITLNKDRLLSIFIAKSIATSYGMAYAGKLVLCKAEDSDFE